MSDIVAALGRLHRLHPRRPLIHLPATGTILDIDDVWQAHRRCAERLRIAGVKAGQVVVAAAGNRSGFVVLTLACRAIGAVLAPVDVSATTAELLELASQLSAAAVVTPDPAVTCGATPVPLDDELFVAARDGSAPAFGRDAALFKLTSGSSGTPKATVVTEAQLIADSRNIIAGMAIGPDDTQIAAIPLSHAYGVSVILIPLLLQGTPIVLRHTFVPGLLPADARACGARVFAGVPFMFQHFLAHPPAHGWPPALSKLISAGAPLPAETAHGFLTGFGVKIHSFYGTSESGGIAYDPSDESAAGDAIGPLLPGVSVELVAEDGLPPGTGRILVRSAGVASGYASGSDPGFRDGGFLTGDYGRFDERGRLMLTGRASSFINVAGRKVEPGEVERILRMMPGIIDVHVTAAADARRGEQVAACLVADQDVTAIAVRQFCAAHLAAHKIPRRVVFVDAIPRTLRGKIDRAAVDALMTSENPKKA